MTFSGDEGDAACTDERKPRDVLTVKYMMMSFDEVMGVGSLCVFEILGVAWILFPYS